ncbi:unnamed protein product [Hymenolepis diminuta]|uniref:Usp domain-containing protein n=1 Tax=Hymenolepis diminuta TaxID=6216 RepID=A0A0R3SFR0_HYMDI|nr:unnamed protein product [Hymenolepis diminuta]VUZ52417.1 unnamed protein product [Hymenolepis diminuta]VUZ57809.1 unnamed protein product [Hymenolepis diminuta]
MYSLCRKVLFPIDNSDSCEQGFQWYIKNSHQKGDEIVLAYILSPCFTRGTHALDGDGSSTGLASDMIEACRFGAMEARRTVERYTQICRNEGIDYRTVALFGTKIGRTIVRAIRDNKIESVVIGFHDMGRIKRAFLGSSSDYVVKRSPVPVIVVPPTDESTS